MEISSPMGLGRTHGATRTIEIIRSGFRGVWLAAREHPTLFVSVALALLLLDVLLPLLILSAVRKPWDYVRFSHGLRALPQWIMWPGISFGRRLGFLLNFGLFWFAGTSPYHTVAWVFEVRTRDIVRWVSMALLAGAYFGSWLDARPWGMSRSRSRGGSGRDNRGKRWLGILLCALGLFASPCSVGGYGAATVLPVIGLAFHGLTTGALTALVVLSTVATTAVFIGLSWGVVALGSSVSRT